MRHRGFPRDDHLCDFSVTPERSGARSYSGRIRKNQTAAGRTRADADRTRHFQCDVERALLLQVVARASERLPTRSKLVVQGPGENAGILTRRRVGVRIQDRVAQSSLVIEPFQGAARAWRHSAGHFHYGRANRWRSWTRCGLAISVGTGFLRLRSDRPRPGRTGQSPVPAQAELNKNHSVMEGVVAGVASMGIVFGVPNLGGEVKFEPSYSGIRW